MASSVLAPAAVDYPSSDGSPVAESDLQLTPITYARDALRDYFRERADVYVSAPSRRGSRPKRGWRNSRRCSGSGAAAIPIAGSEATGPKMPASRAA